MKYSEKGCWCDWPSWVLEDCWCFTHAGGSWEQDRQHSLKSTTQPLLKKMCFLGWVRCFKCKLQSQIKDSSCKKKKEIIEKHLVESTCIQTQSHWIFLYTVFDCDFWHAALVSSTFSRFCGLLLLCDWQIVNYNYYYSLNAWLLLCPWWLCFDWSMGCVPLIKSATDWRMVWLLLLWCFLIGLINQALCSPDSQRRR